MDFESQLRLERDAEVVAATLEAVGGQLVHRDDDPPGLYWARIKPRAVEAPPFVVRLWWDVYPDRQPSALFASEVGGVTALPSAWPAAPGYRAPNDVCKPFTAEGRGLHPEWANGPHAWRSEGNPFLYVVETIQGDIDRVDGRRAG